MFELVVRSSTRQARRYSSSALASCFIRQTHVGVLIMMRSLSTAFFITQGSLNSSDRAKFLIPLRKSASKKKPAGTARVIIEMHQLLCFAK
jgi:hypothetical protein